MSTVTGVSSGTTNATTTNTQVLGQDDFLKMLVAQLQNQDPLNPLQGADFAAQLAQFSSLDQLTQINTQLSTLTSSLSSANNSQLVGLIGDAVVANGNSVTVSGATTNWPIIYRRTPAKELSKFLIVRVISCKPSHSARNRQAAIR